MLHGLDLFSGYGGISYALREIVTPVAYCEIERYAQGILLSRMSEGDLVEAPIWDDVRTLTAEQLPSIDIIYGGFPCQDISVAGSGKGLEGKRSGLFFEVCRLVEEIKPTFVFLENVPAIRTRGLRAVVRELTDLRYDCRWTCVSAEDVGAPHLRKRWFLLAYSQREQLRNEPRRGSRESRKREAELGDNGETESMANTDSQRLEGRDSGELQKRTGKGAARKGSSQVADSKCKGLEKRKGESGQSLLRTELNSGASVTHWQVEPKVGRVADGITARVDRIKALGNGVVPLQAKVAFERLMGLECR